MLRRLGGLFFLCPIQLTCVILFQLCEGMKKKSPFLIGEIKIIVTWGIIGSRQRLRFALHSKVRLLGGWVLQQLGSRFTKTDSLRDENPVCFGFSA